MSWDAVKFFKPGEFDSPDKPGSGLTGMDVRFVLVLDKIRAKVGFPLQVNSGFRTAAHNHAVGGVSSSAHTKGIAADIHTGGWAETFKVIDAARFYGIQRIGIPASGTYVHLDMSGTLPSPRYWFYP